MPRFHLKMAMICYFWTKLKIVVHTHYLLHTDCTGACDQFHFHFSFSLVFF